jgi:hypothetical protein
MSEMPQSWVTPKSPKAPLFDRETLEKDWFEGIDEADAPLLPLAPPLEDPSAYLRAEFERICEILGYAPFPLQVRHRLRAHTGYVTGKIWTGALWRRMELTVGPNSDLAEQYAVLVHEFAHLFEGPHNETFKEWMVDVACAAYGDQYFEQARAVIDRRYHFVNLWVSVGIRAALQGKGVVPCLKVLEDEVHTAHIVSRIQKLQRLAAKHPGTAEARSACGKANSLIAIYGLQEYEVVLPDANIDAEMCDEWTQLDTRSPWQLSLAHQVSVFFNVFSLAHSRVGRMHLFGQYGDIQAAKYLTEISIASLKRTCEIYLEQEHAKRGTFERGQRVSLRAAYLNSASIAFRRKLHALKRKAENAHVAAQTTPEGEADVEVQATALTLLDMANAEAFAGALYEERGRKWRGGRARDYKFNSAGNKAGRDLGIHRGVGGGGPKRLT